MLNNDKTHLKIPNAPSILSFWLLMLMVSDTLTSAGKPFYID